LFIDGVTGKDAAFPGNLTGWTGPVAGYYGGPEAYNVWTKAQWDQFTVNRKLPIWVAGLNGSEEATVAVDMLTMLQVPRKSLTAVDLEERVDNTYLQNFGSVMHNAGYKVLVYGSATTVFGNLQLNGYWVADWTGQAFMYNHLGVRGTQYASTPVADFDLWKPWVIPSMWK
jgi:hypothetical protein